MMETRQESMTLEGGDDGRRSYSDGHSLRYSRMPLEQQRCLLSNRNQDNQSLNSKKKSIEVCNGHHYLSFCRKGLDRRTRRRFRIKSWKYLSVIAIFYFSSSISSGFPLKSLASRNVQHMLITSSSTTKKPDTFWKYRREKKITYPIGMNQNDDNTSEKPDDKERNDGNNQQGEEIKILRKEFKKRISRLEDIVSRQEVEIHRLKNTCAELSHVSEAFGQLLKLLKEAGLDADKLDTNEDDLDEKEGIKGNDESAESNGTTNKLEASLGKVIESYDDALIFGTAPTSVIDAADGAGAAILAAMLGGKQRMLVDVRDAELSNDPEILVQFIELAILPIAAGLEGLKSTRNRVKIVFPKVSQLLEYRRTMALAAPEVVALSTLGFDPVEKRDKLVVIVAPEPDDEEGIQAIQDLLTPSEEGLQPIQQPVVILNYHMVPFSGVEIKFETAYHLRLLAVQFMADAKVDDSVELEEGGISAEGDYLESQQTAEVQDLEVEKDSESEESDDDALESAMKHAHEPGVNEGVTRAMVIRAYPRPWHIFVDLSPNTNADFEVAATFDEEPTMDELNFAIVECLEGSEREDEIVAQQMQQALEDGQLNEVSSMLSETLDKYFNDVEDEMSLGDDDDDDDDFDMFEEDSV